MKKFIVLALPLIVFCACSSDEPEVSDRGRSYSRPRKAPPSVSSQPAEDFRAVERPSTYSE